MKRNIIIIIGFFYVIFILWNRLIRERLAREIFVNFDSFILLMYFLFFFVSLFIVILSVRKVFHIKNKYRILNYIVSFSIIERIFRFGADIIINYVLKGPNELYEWLYKRIKIRPIIDMIVKKIYIWSLNENRLFFFCFLCFKNLLYFIVLSFFLYDVFYLNYLSKFYKSLILLIIPLLIDIVLFIVYNLAKKNIKVIEEWINFPIKADRTGYNMQLRVENLENPLLKIKDEKLLLEIMTGHYYTWLYYLYSCMTIDNFNSKDAQIKPFIYIIIYTLYSIGWGYILIKIYSISKVTY